VTIEAPALIKRITAFSPRGGRVWARLSRILGPGLVTGASDDDPSGIATYSQAGAQFGFTIT
jgi:Mn2+/Fe2+ NRAMP family transporter